MPIIDKLLGLRKKERRFTAGKVLYSQGETADSLFVVLSGAVETFYLEDSIAEAEDIIEDECVSPKRIKLGIITERNIFGEVEMLQRIFSERPTKRLFSACGLRGGLIVEISYSSLAPLVKEGGELTTFLFRYVTSQLEDLAQALGQARYGTIDSKLANALINRANAYGVKLQGRGQYGQVVRLQRQTVQSEIAEEIGARRETASRILNDWERAGMVRTGRDKQLFITDYERIKLIATARPSPGRASHSDALTRVDDLIGSGDNFRARNFALYYLEQFPRSPEMQYRACLAAARAGAFEEALQLAKRFKFDQSPETLKLGLAAGLRNPLTRRNGAQDDDDDDRPLTSDEDRRLLNRLCEDVAALLPRIQKDIAFAAGPDSVREDALQKAYEGYAAAYRAFPGGFTAINTASMARLLGLVDASAQLARLILEESPPKPESYWDAVILAEAHVLLNDWPQARRAMGHAASRKDIKPGMTASTRLQFSRLRTVVDPAEMDAVIAELPAPVSLVYTGHMMRGSQLSAGQQIEAEKQLSDSLNNSLEKHSNIGHAYGALACGADIIIAERLLQRQAKLHVVLPMRFADFLEKSVSIGDPAASSATSWVSRFDECLARAESVTILYDYPVKVSMLEALFCHAFRYAAGLALLRADEVVGEAQLIAVHDGGAADSIAGTGMAVRGWGAERARTILSCPWRSANTDAVAVEVDTPFRPVVFVWPQVKTAPNDRTKTADQGAEVAGPAVEDTHSLLKAIKSALEPTAEKLILGMHLRPARFGYAAVFATMEDAIRGAMTLGENLGDAFAEIRVICDHGLVHDLSDKLYLENINRLRAAADISDVPTGIVVATEPFAAEARLDGTKTAHFQPIGRVDAPNNSREQNVPLPSIRMFRMALKGLL